jgi:DME family drug/metabolite transporter
VLFAEEIMLGAGIALITSLAWSISSICVKLVADKIDSLSINTLRTWVGSFLLVFFILSTGRYETFNHISWESLAYIVVSGLLAMVIGDTIYIKSVALLDVSIAFPLSQCSFILLAVLSAILFLDERFTWVTVIGGVLVVIGIYLMTSSKGQKEGSLKKKGIHPKGLLFILIAVIVWTGATIALKVGVTGADPVLSAGLRISSSAVVLMVLFLSGMKKGNVSFLRTNKKNLVLIAASGLLTYGLAAVGYISALQLIGAGKTVLLTASAPLFTLPLSILILKEKPTRFAILGVFFSVLGVCLVVV